MQLVFGFEVKLAWEVGRTGLRWHCTCLESLHKPLPSIPALWPTRVATKEQLSVSPSPAHYTLLKEWARPRKACVWRSPDLLLS